MTELCTDDALQALMVAMQTDDGTELVQVDRLILEFPEDPRLHFLRGSVLASIGRPIEALPALQRAVELAPDFAIARFQLGFFQLTSGEAANALGTWGPLALLPEEHYLRKFVAGLTHLIRDEFEESVKQLREGIALNQENPPLNRDMQLIIEQASVLAAEGAGRTDADGEAASTTSFLLDQLSGRGRPH
jgi:tetratricopeptide (TPR) repeat protein